MENKIAFGTYNVPTLDVSLSATYTVPGTLSNEQKAIFSSVNKSENTDFNAQLTGILNVPKPKK